MAQKNTKNEQIEGDLSRGIENLFRSAWYGARSLRSPPRWIGMIICTAICIVAFLNRGRIWQAEELFGRPLTIIPKIFMLAFAFLLPLIYLSALGGAANGSDPDEFEKIGFVGKDGKPPREIYRRREKHAMRKLEIVGYQSYIPLDRWKSCQNDLEVALNCSIRNIQQGKDKRTVELMIVSTEVQMPELVEWNDNLIPAKEGVVCVGEDQLQQVTFDLNKTPHVLIAGETGSGKSVILRTILWQMINKGCRIYMIDFKGGVEFGKRFEQYGEVVTDRKRALVVFQLLVAENAARLRLFREMEVKNLPEYNRKTGKNLCRIAVFIDEIAEMLDRTGAADKQIYDDLEGCLSTLARLSRATGINLIIGVQRPDAKILTGQIKNNVPVRICGRFADKAPSEIVLGNTMACGLPDVKGRFLYRMGNEMTEFQAYLFDDDKHLKSIEVDRGELLITGGAGRSANRERLEVETEEMEEMETEEEEMEAMEKLERKGRRPVTQKRRGRKTAAAPARKTADVEDDEFDGY